MPDPARPLYSAPHEATSLMNAARRLLAPLFASAVAFVATSVAAALPPGVTQGPSVEGITQYTLANGLTVLLFPDASAAKTTVNLTYLVGSRQENYGETGMAHLLEHMMFKGTPTSGDPEGGADQARDALQRVDLVRPHELPRDVQRVARGPRSGRSRWKRTGWSTRKSRAPISTAR